MRVGVVDQTGAGWFSGGEYTRVQVSVLLSAAAPDSRDEVVLISERPDDFKLPPGLGAERFRAVARWPSRWFSLGERVRRRILEPVRLWRDPRVREWRQWADRRGLDVILSFDPPEWWHPCGVPVCSWIPDFQHVRLPQFFSHDERAYRDVSFRRRAALCDLVVLSSRSVAQGLGEFAPDCAHKARVYPFPSMLCFEPPPPAVGVEQVLTRYGVERDFMLVVNQFWAHKNHIQVVEAMGWLARDRRCPQVVMIGQPSDNRDPTGKALSHLLRRVAELKLEGRVKLLGFVAAAERDALLRSCKALIQPSRCEGRNTSVEDAKALGRPVIASDIPVHREQSPAAFGFAAPDDAEGLAALMERADRELTPGPDPAREQQCLAAARADALDAGRRLWETCREAAGLRTLRRGGPGRTA